MQTTNLVNPMLPQEITEAIIDFCDPESLPSLSLTARVMRMRSQARQFNSVTLDEENTFACERFVSLSPHIPSLVKNLTIVEGLGTLYVANASRRGIKMVNRGTLWAYDDDAFVRALEMMANVEELIVEKLVWPIFKQRGRCHRALLSVARSVGSLQLQKCVFQNLAQVQSLVLSPGKKLTDLSLRELTILDCMDIEGEGLMLDIGTPVGDLSDEESEDDFEDMIINHEVEVTGAGMGHTGEPEVTENEASMIDDQDDDEPLDIPVVAEEDRATIMDLMIEIADTSDEIVLDWLLSPDSQVTLDESNGIWIVIAECSTPRLEKIQSLLDIAASSVKLLDLNIKLGFPEIHLRLPDLETLRCSYMPFVFASSDAILEWWSEIFEAVQQPSTLENMTLCLHPLGFTMRSGFIAERDEVPLCWQRLDAALCRPEFEALKSVRISPLPPARDSVSEEFASYTEWVYSDCLKGLGDKGKAHIDWELYNMACRDT
ncbi:hypothetical protein BDZ89DRAFT_1165524 [Hymenopellis radicata]|nr:hypothetical protein BDZ89DRAFT_1165524 [Hymenopellis radicata]